MNDNVLKDMYDVIEDRRKNPEEGSYTCYLFNQGIDKILKKVGNFVFQLGIISVFCGDYRFRPDLPSSGNDERERIAA